MCLCIIPGKNLINDGNQKILLSSKRIFPLILVGFGNFTSFLDALHRFRPFNDGNQLPGCRLFSSYDVNMFECARTSLMEVRKAERPFSYLSYIRTVTPADLVPHRHIFLHFLFDHLLVISYIG